MLHIKNIQVYLHPTIKILFDTDMGIFMYDACLVGVIFNGCKVPISVCKEIP